MTTDCRITDLRTLLLAVPMERPVILPFGQKRRRVSLLVIVETSAGIQGVGEVWVNWPAWGCEDRVSIIREAIRPILVGESLDQPERLYALLWRRLRPLAQRWSAPGPISHAIAGVDLALWDAAARRAGQPLRNFIAGQTGADRVKVYASEVGPNMPGPTIERAMTEGHTRFKLSLLNGPEKDSAALREAREAAGDNPLMADAAETYNATSVRAIWDDIVAVRLDWLEEPFPVYDDESYRAYRTLPNAPPLALGESNYGLESYRRLLDDYSPQVVQPDLTKTAGISEGREIAKLVIGQGRRLCLHILAGPVGLIASANFMAAINGTDILEMDVNPMAFYGAVLGAKPRVRDGWLELSRRPGLGFDLNEKALAEWTVRRPACP